MSSVFCQKCGTENNAEYNYCIGCGTPLAKPESSFQEPCSANACSDGAQAPVASIGNMPIAAAVEFVGDDPNKYIPKFIKFDASKSYASWNWAAAIWAFFGLPFVWFFYRKMYKIGAILLVICLALSLVSVLAIAPVFQTAADAITPYIEQILANPYVEIPEELINQLISQGDMVSQVATSNTVNNLVGFLELCIFVFTSIAANGLYMKHMLKVFNKAAEKNPEGVTSLEIRRLGGTSVGAAIGAAIGYFVATVIIVVVPLYTALANYIKTVIELALNSNI